MQGSTKALWRKDEAQLKQDTVTAHDGHYTATHGDLAGRRLETKLRCPRDESLLLSTVPTQVYPPRHTHLIASGKGCPSALALQEGSGETQCIFHKLRGIHFKH